ncbi:DegT/DnrJ/EryC1/StrS family aminotransferase [Photorhabdus tasmaniensis]|uniref:DegT/DnrJ/EryC1/StrS family aminotransferase n=1 Tax=Photorhabdus tasmaniensis TaxID=1004159 RepID=UPI004042EBE7
MVSNIFKSLRTIRDDFLNMNPWPIISELEKEEILRCLDSGEISYYASGKKIHELEGKFKCFLGRKYAVALNSGTSALYLAFLCCGFSREDEILVQSYTFPATVMPLLHINCTPLLVDNAPGKSYPTVAEFQERLSLKTKAIVITHMDGIPAQMHEIKAFAEKHNLIIIEDCAQALGASRDGSLVGTMGDISIFSITDKKIVVGGEGGILLTDDYTIYEKVILLGYLQKRSFEDVALPELSKFSYTGLGFNFRMHPFAAAMACVQFDSFKKHLENRRKFEKWLDKLLEPFNFVYPIESGKNVVKSQYSIKYFIDNSRCDINELVKAGKRCGLPIEKTTTVPLHRSAIFSNESLEFVKEHGFNERFSRNSDFYFPNSEEYVNNSIRFPALYTNDPKYRDWFSMNIRSLFAGFM